MSAVLNPIFRRKALRVLIRVESIIEEATQLERLGARLGVEVSSEPLREYRRRLLELLGHY